MISIQEFRALLGPEAEGKSDAEIAAILDQFYAWSRIVLKAVEREIDARRAGKA